MKRTGRIAKRGFRLLFKDTYGSDELPTGGPKTLDFPLFADTPVTRFNSIVLKGPADHSYVYTDGIRAQYIREHWGRDTIGDMGDVTTHGTYVHMYLNGLYWGLYSPFERRMVTSRQTIKEVIRTSGTSTTAAVAGREH